ncbi:hypothetical protein EVAR_97659_1 [Eumeta japonica]|uniref:Uncharacterized protein n=1 Tax=Eumeta variegata TaxID=151549 RepID=A0A4C1WWN2_EUMVA|nr:hypothetical protein EVAR_97659_1 [Eumeta japonica]
MGSIGTYTHLAKRNSGSCYFTPAFCEGVVSHRLVGHIFTLQPSLSLLDKHDISRRTLRQLQPELGVSGGWHL